MDYRAYAQKAEEAFDTKNYAEAIRLWTFAIGTFPKEGEASYDKNILAMFYNNRGICYHTLKDYGNAIADYNQAIELDPEFAICYYHRGNIHRELKNYTNAIADYSQAIKLEVNLPVVYMNRGNAYGKLRYYDKALADYNEAIKLNPNDTQAYFNRGLVYYTITDYTNAIKDFKKAIELNQGYAKAHYYLAKCYEALKETKLALEYYTNMFNVLKGHSDLEAYHKRIRLENAISIFKFSPFNENTLKTLINSKLFLSQPHKHWNDPHDCNIMDWGEEAQKLFHQKARLQAFMMEKEGKKPYKNTLLWAHYADSHKGVCIEYKYALNHKNPIATLHEVKYQSEIEFGELSDAFRIKATDWQYENEVRLFHFDESNKEDTNVVKPFKELGLTIKAVYFGTKCSKDNKDTITKILAKQEDITQKRIEFYNMTTDRRSFILEAKDLDCEAD